MTNLLLISVRADVGGGPVYLDKLVNGLDSEKVKIFIACPKDEPYFSNWEKNANIKSICTIPHRKVTINSFRDVLKFIKTHNIQVVHTNGKGAGLYRLVKLFQGKLRVIHTYHGIHIQNMGAIKKKVYFMYEKALSFLTTHFINVSKGEKEICLQNGLIKDEKSTVIYNGVMRKNIDGPKAKKFSILTLSRFDYQKNMECCFAIANHFKDDSSIEFIWVGDGEERLSLEEKANVEKVNIKFLGFRNDVADLMAKSHIYLSTSRWEGLPFALVEALSQGLPIVASNVVGNNEVVEHNVNGFLFNLENIQEGIAQIKELRQNETLHLTTSQSCIETYQKSFTEKNMIQQSEQILLFKG